MMKTTNFLLTFCYLIVINPSYAFKNIEHSSLQADIQQFVLAQVKSQRHKQKNININVSVRAIDPRLKLKQCAKPLAFELQGQTIKRNNTVKVSCRSKTTPWSIFTMSTITQEVYVIGAATELPRRHIITQEDLIPIKQDIHKLRGGYATKEKILIGQQLRRPARAGSVIYQNQLQLPKIVKKGDKVTIITNRGGLSVIHQGIAMGNASKGERVQVKNKRSSRIIQASVISPGRVEVL